MPELGSSRSITPPSETGITVLITGGTRGLGRSIALRYARPNASLILNYRSDDTAAESTAREVRELGARVVLVKADLARSTEVQRVVDAVADLGGGLDVLVHNAFYLTWAPPLTADATEIDTALAVGPKALLNIVQLASPLFPESGGQVIATLSIATKRLFDVRTGPSYFPMALAKGALEVLIRYLAVELGPRRISVNGVSAGWIGTDTMLQDSRAAFRESASRRTPLGRIATPEEIADVIHFLGSQAGRWITGQVLIADGGLSLI